MAIKTNSKSITIPYFVVGVPPYSDQELQDTIDACQKALNAQKPKEDSK